MIKNSPESEAPTFTPSSGNVFVDLAVPYPERELLRATLSAAIIKNLDTRMLTDEDASALTGSPARWFRHLRHGKSAPLGLEWLMMVLDDLGCAVRVVVSIHPKTTQP